MYLWSDWWCLLHVSSQSIIIHTFNMILVNGKPFSRSQKHLRTAYLWSSVALEIWLAIYFNHQKSTCGLPGYVCSKFQTWLFYLVSIWSWSMEKHLPEVNKMSDSFRHGLHQHYKYCWLYIYYQKSTVDGLMIFAWCWQ